MKLYFAVIFSILFSTFQVMALDCELRCSLGNYQLSETSEADKIASNNELPPCHGGSQKTNRSSNQTENSKDKSKASDSSKCGNACSFSVFEYSPKVEVNLQNVDKSQFKKLASKVITTQSLLSKDFNNKSHYFAFYKSMRPPGLESPIYILFEKYLI